VDRTCSTNGETTNAYSLLFGKVEGRVGRPRHRCMDNIKMDLVEILWGGVD
jgi:hypothetical protein